jgi:hypothetical protein
VISFRVRAGTLRDHPTLVRLFPELGISDPVPTQEQFEQRFLPRVLILEEENGEPTGYAYWRTYASTVHVGHIIVDPRAREEVEGALFSRRSAPRRWPKGATDGS